MHLCRQAESYDDWIDNRVFGQSVSPDHMIICDALHAAVSSLDSEAMKRLFIFITGNDRVPVTEGEKIKVSLLPTDRLPSSHSCFQQLDIGYLRYVDANGTIDELHEKMKTDLYRSLEQYNVFTGDGIL